MMAIIPLICILQTQGKRFQGGCGCNPASPIAKWRKVLTTSSLLPEFHRVPDQQHPCPVFVKRVRTRVHRGSVITSLHSRVTWMYRLYRRCISVTLVRAHGVFAGFGSPSAPGGNAPSSKKPACHPLEKAFEEGWAGSSDRQQLRALHHDTDGVWPSPSCPRTRWATWRSCSRRSLLHHLSREGGGGGPGGGQPWQTSHQGGHWGMHPHYFRF